MGWAGGETGNLRGALKEPKAQAKLLLVINSTDKFIV